MRRSSITRALILAVFAIIPLGARYQLVLAQDQFEHPKFPPGPHERQQVLPWLNRPNMEYVASTPQTMLL